MARTRRSSEAFPPGTFVRRQSSGGDEPEYGVVVQPETGGGGGPSYYVACFSASSPGAGPISAPDIRRFAASSLERIDRDPRRPVWERPRKVSAAEKVMKGRAFWAILLILKIGVWVALIWVLIRRSSCA